MTGEIWGRLRAAVGDDSVTANTIRQFFRAVVWRKLGTDETSLDALQEANANKEEGRRPRFGNLTMKSQKILKEMVRDQYTSLPKGQDAELLIEEAFNLLFKAKHQYPNSKARGSKLNPLSILLKITYSFLLGGNDNGASEPETNLSTCEHSINPRFSIAKTYKRRLGVGSVSPRC